MKSHAKSLRRKGFIRKESNMVDWESCGIVVEGQPIDVSGVDPWLFQWTPLDGPLSELPHPLYPYQVHKMRVYEIRHAEKRVVFAAGELSANVWGFYVPSAH